MPSTSSLLVSALAATAVTAGPLTKRSASIDITQVPGPIDATAAAQKAFARLSGNTGAASGSATSPETLDAGFWFGNFTVGKATGLSLLIDTGSADVAVNPGKYKASSSSKALGRSGRLQYITTQENGCGAADVSYNAYSDVVSQAGLVSPQQTFGNITKTTPPDSGTITQFPHDGIVGFSGTSQYDSQSRGVPFFQSLCNANAVSSCRFGLAFGTSGNGKQVLGALDSTLYTGSMTTVDIESQWTVTGNSAVNGQTLQSNQNFILDSGTANVIGPQSQVKALFKKLGLQAVEQNLPGCAQTLFGYYQCDKPPTVGFSFGDGEVYNIEPSAFKLADNGNNNCTAIVTGLDFDGSGSSDWILGQAWFQGKYIDHNSDQSTVGIATLKNKAG